MLNDLCVDTCTLLTFEMFASRALQIHWNGWLCFYDFKDAPINLNISFKIDCNWQTNSIYHFHIICNPIYAVTGLRTYVNAIRIAKNPHKFIINKSNLAHSLKLVMLMFWNLWLIINYNTNENPYLLLFNVCFHSQSNSYWTAASIVKLQSKTRNIDNQTANRNSKYIVWMTTITTITLPT